MEFPNFETTDNFVENQNFQNQNENNNFYNQFDNHQQNNNFEDYNEIQIENMEFNNDQSISQTIGFNQVPLSQGMNMGMEWNQMNSNQMGMGHSNDINDEERNRIQARKEEEEARRAKIVKKMNDEMRIKQEFRDKARQYCDNWNE
jgi:hypothetical protein